MTQCSRIVRRWMGLAAVLWLAAPGLAGENWPRFRGPNGSGVSEQAAPVRWTADDYAWKLKLPGAGHSSPVVWGDNVYVTAADEDAGERLLLCVGASDGRTRWRHAVRFKTFRMHGENSYASSTPAADDKHVYVQWTSPEQFGVVAVRHGDGGEAWRADLGPYRTQHGGGSSPVALGGLVIVNVDQDKPQSFIAGLDRDTGAVRWRTPRDSTRFSTSTPCVYRPADGGPGQLVFTTHANGFTALDPATGRILWELPGAFGDRVVSSTLAGDGLVLGAAGEGARGKGVVVVRPPAAKGGSAAVAYTLTDEVPYVPTPLVYRGRLFTWSDGGTVTCHDAATGAQIWRDRVRGGGGFFGSPVCAGGKLYCVSKRGEVVVVDADGDKFRLLARNDLGEPTDATPALADGRIYLRTLTHLVCVGGTRVADARRGTAR